MKKFLTSLTIITVVAWCLLALLSWLLSAMMVGGVRSLLTGEGLRWLFGNMTEGLLSPLLVWLILVAMSWGCLKGIRSNRSVAFRSKQAFRVAVLITLAYGAVITLLSAMPHAVLLSSTGTLWHSPFSRALIPLTCFGAMLFCMAYGLVSRAFTSLSSIVEAMLDGLRSAVPLFYAYMLLMPLVLALCYVFW